MEAMQVGLIRDPVERKLHQKQQSALDQYLDNQQKYGEEDSRTQMKLLLYVLRSYLIEIKEQVKGMKEILIDFGEISEEIDGMFEIGSDQAANFMRGLEKYPRFLRKRLAMRRARKYYNMKFDKVRIQLEVVEMQLEFVPQFMQMLGYAVTNMSVKMSKSLMGGIQGKGKGKKGKGGGVQIPDFVQKEIDRRKKERSGDTKQDVGTDGSGTSDSASSGTPSGGGDMVDF